MVYVPMLTFQAVPASKLKEMKSAMIPITHSMVMQGFNGTQATLLDQPVQIKVNDTPDIYRANFHFDQPRFSNITKTKLDVFRVLTLMVFFGELASTIATSELVWLIEYETYWSFSFSWICLLATIKSSLQGKDSKWFKFACIASEVSFALDIFATVLFWILLAPIIFPLYPHTWWGNWQRWRMITLHTLPFLSSLANMILTKVQFIEEDWKICFSIGILYIPFNYYGELQQKTPLYPVTDWEHHPI